MWFGTVNIEKGTQTYVNAVLEENASIFIEKSKSSSITQSMTLSENITAPIQEGDIVGSIIYISDGEVIKTVNLVSDSTVKKLNLVNMTFSLFDDWFRLLR